MLRRGHISDAVTQRRGDAAAGEAGGTGGAHGSSGADTADRFRGVSSATGDGKPCVTGGRGPAERPSRRPVTEQRPPSASASGKPDSVNSARKFEEQDDVGPLNRRAASRERVAQWLWPLAAVAVVIGGMVLGYAFFS